MKPVRVVVGVLLAGFLSIQLVPYGRDHRNGPVRAEPRWDSAQTRWYANVASWLVQSHVDEGRAALNLSEWDRAYEEAPESPETVREGEMPMRSYLWLHPSARLTAQERRDLIRGLEATFGEAEG